MTPLKIEVTEAIEDAAYDAYEGVAWDASYTAIRAALTAAFQHPEFQAQLNQWRPIESAPRDGSVILVCHKRGTWLYPKDQRRINCVVVFWSDGRFKEFGPDSFKPSELDCWMPLLEPPAIAPRANLAGLLGDGE